LPNAYPDWDPNGEWQEYYQKPQMPPRPHWLPEPDWSGSDWGIIPGEGLPAVYGPMEPTVSAQKETDVLNLLEMEKKQELNIPIFKLAVAINSDESMTVKLSETKQFKKAATVRFPFQSVVAGYYGDAANGGDNFKQKYKDTDSVQIAARWQDGDGTDVGHETNALPQQIRNFGATWTFAGASPNQTATYTTKTKAPECAVKLNVIVLYTDGFYEHADLSVIFGSFTATRKNAQSRWTIIDNPADLFEGGKGKTKTQRNNLERDQSALQGMDGDLAVTEALKGLQQKTQDVLMRQTGYSMQRRIQTMGPNKGWGLNSYQDTGYDIVIR
jgi:hypothetical protein